MLFFTASLDRMVCIWDMNCELKGRLQQGYMMKADYKWDFPLKNHKSDDNHEARQAVAKDKLVNARNERLKNDRQYQLLAAEAAKKMANMRSSLGFQGDHLKNLLGVGGDEGFTTTSFGNIKGEHTNPAGYHVTQTTEYQTQQPTQYE